MIVALGCFTIKTFTYKRMVSTSNEFCLLEFSFGIKENALTWVMSYLTERTQYGSVADKTSPDVVLLFGCIRWIRSRTKELLYVYQTSRHNNKYYCIQDPVSYIQSTEWNNTSVSKPSDRNIYTSENALICVLVIFEGTKKPYSNVRKEIILSISSQAVE